LARLVGAVSVEALGFKGRLRPLDAGWDLQAKLTAHVVQRCVVSLDPVTERVEQTVRRRFLPEATPVETEIEISPEHDDEIEPLGRRIDLGLVATEALALALPDYPRRPGAQLIGVTEDDIPGEESEGRPFAALAALRDRMGGRS
jgi:uncharacterized metal-binding protein YceD (DUF177 family)